MKFQRNFIGNKMVKAPKDEGGSLQLSNSDPVRSIIKGMII